MVTALTELVTDSIATTGETPLDVQIRAGNTAGAAFQASFVIYADVVVLKPIYVRRAKEKAGLLRTIFQAFFTIDYSQVALFIYFESV